MRCTDCNIDVHTFYATWGRKKFCWKCLYKYIYVVKLQNGMTDHILAENPDEISKIHPHVKSCKPLSYNK